MATMTMKEWIFRCGRCDKKFGILCWNYELDGQKCLACNERAELYIEPRGKAPGIATDDIPGGIEIRHLSPKPERFYSKTEIKRACNERGFNWAGDTPKKYNVHWSGKTKADANKTPAKS